VQGEGAWQRLLTAIATDVERQPLLSYEELRRARLPIQLVYGDRDVFAPADHAVEIYRQLPDARLFVAPDCPHAVMVHQPALFNQVAGQFFRSTEQVARRRAERGAAAAPMRTVGDGAALLDPTAITPADPQPSSGDPFDNWS
jgi:fermentation-respiration switch protein FrsA (DUF1100 family)